METSKEAIKSHLHSLKPEETDKFIERASRAHHIPCYLQAEKEN